MFMVCDGLGGQANGDIASNITIRTISSYGMQPSSLAGIDLQLSINSAVEALAEHAAKHPESDGMATTLALACINKSAISLAWCGDSRIIHIRNGIIIYQTKDHTLINELIQQGALTEEEAHDYPQRNILQRSINSRGSRSLPELHTLNDIVNNDWLVICSDGLLELLSPKDLAQVLAHNPTTEQLAIYLYSIGLAHTSDNCSGHIIQLHC